MNWSWTSRDFGKKFQPSSSEKGSCYSSMYNLSSHESKSIGSICEWNGMEWNGTVHETYLILKQNFLKLTTTFLLFTSNQSFFFITFQIKKNNYKTKIFTFLYKIFLLFFSHINHICYSTVPLYIPFHSQTEPLINGFSSSMEKEAALNLTVDFFKKIKNK